MMKFKVDKLTKTSCLCAAAESHAAVMYFDEAKLFPNAEGNIKVALT